DIKNTKAYKEYYACATREAAPKPKVSAKKKRGGSASSTTHPTLIATPTPITTVVAAPRLTAAAKGKQPARATNPTDHTEVERTEAEQLKIVLRRSRQETHISQHGGFSTDERTGSKPGVPDVPSDDSEEEISDQTKGRDDNEGEKTDESGDDDDNQDEAEKVNDDDDDEEEISKIDEQEATESGDGDDKETESDRESEEEETTEKEEESFDPIPRTPEESEDDGNGEEDQCLRISEEERMYEDEEADELYRGVDINQGRRLQVSQDIEDSHVTLTPTHSDGQQESLSTSSSVTNLLNPIIDPCMESILTTGSSSVTHIPSPKSKMTPSIITTTTAASQPPIPLTPIPSDIFQLFQLLRRTIDDNMKKIIKEQVKSQVKAQVTRILPRIEESVNAQLEAEVLTKSSHSSRTSYAVAADLSEMELKNILIENMEGNKSIQRSDEQRNLYKALVDAYEADKTILESYGETAILKRNVRMMMMIRKNPPLDQTGGLRDDEKAGSMHQPALHLNQLPGVPAGPQQGLNLDRCLPVSLLLQRNLCRLPVRWRNPHIRCLKQVQKINPLFKLLSILNDTPIDFFNFIMNRLGVDTLTPELLAGPTYELMRGSCNSLTELEYHLEEVYKVTTDQLDWVNPEGKQYPHNLLQPLSLIPDNRVRRAADYGHIKWIEDLVPRTMWIQESINYDKHALWGVSHWGQKRQQFYGFAVNRESALDVYSKRRIIAITDLKIVEWHNYKHLDWISVRRDDNKIYKFKEGNFKRLRLQDIKDMLLLIVQGKLSNLTVEECFAFNVSLRMFTRSIVIQRRVKDLQLGVESYQKRLNLTKPDTYRFNLKRREAYTAYSNPRGFIYQNKNKKNRLMRIDELQKFSDGTLNDVRNALDDRLKGIRMQYLPTTI
nr:hypothetical protein [Tanacetum cinerariifolium]